MKLTGFDGRRAFVTGAAGGIGLAAVRLLHEAGAMVTATDLPAALETLPTDATDLARWEPLDVSDPEAVTKAIARAEAGGPLTLGLHAAGALFLSSMLETPAEDWRRIFDINTHGTFFVTQALGRVMAPRGTGAIVAVASNSAGIPRLGMGGYPASKAAAAMAVRCLGLELGQHGVRCNLVNPGSTLTPMQTGMWDDAESGAAGVIRGSLDSFKSGIPLGKLATPEDIARAAIFLLSDEAGHITMADLYVDGGATQRA
ncbi:SDR family oxidoreductase [Pseudooceanicola algae]|uniref:2,3-dihydro-2,3-dihydroxybenzoate dehydrogenase n=1 Tax=Pseudooceanicola algae TaxID=1537215 RepID=A0A418SFR4_9RHOB|nr:SDR family oxidoreductase [Pseudooceanicola algae]QPM91529.1 2,3-dihydro-2,3-dihydroxybenzoate dehydrogenase [Pseudooceanicola algae]